MRRGRFGPAMRRSTLPSRGFPLPRTARDGPAACVATRSARSDARAAAPGCTPIRALATMPRRARRGVRRVHVRAPSARERDMKPDTSAHLEAASAAAPPAAAALESAASNPSGHARFSVIGAVSFVHLLNDMMQSVIVTIYPLLKGEFELSFVQIGVITLTFQLTASLLQPVVGTVTDKRPLPYSLPVGMCFTFGGLLLLSVAPSYPVLLLSVALIGCGSSVFHPESSRVARMASGGRYG